MEKKITKHQHIIMRNSNKSKLKTNKYYTINLLKKLQYEKYIHVFGAFIHFEEEICR